MDTEEIADTIGEWFLGLLRVAFGLFLLFGLLGLGAAAIALTMDGRCQARAQVMGYKGHWEWAAGCLVKDENGAKWPIENIVRSAPKSTE